MAELMTRVTVRMPRHVARQLERKARRQASSKSQLVLRAIEQFLGAELREREYRETELAYRAMTAGDKEFHRRLAEEDFLLSEAGLRLTDAEPEKAWW